MTAPAGLHEAATETRRHYTEKLRATTIPPLALTAGRVGAAFCDGYLRVEDDAQRDAWAAYWGWSYRPTPMADLPLCKRCARKAAKR